MTKNNCNVWIDMVIIERMKNSLGSENEGFDLSKNSVKAEPPTDWKSMTKKQFNVWKDILTQWKKADFNLFWLKAVTNHKFQDQIHNF